MPTDDPTGSGKPRTVSFCAHLQPPDECGICSDTTGSKAACEIVHPWGPICPNPQLPQCTRVAAAIDAKDAALRALQASHAEDMRVAVEQAREERDREWRAEIVDYAPDGFTLTPRDNTPGEAIAKVLTEAHAVGFKKGRTAALREAKDCVRRLQAARCR